MRRLAAFGLVLAVSMSLLRAQPASTSDTNASAEVAITNDDQSPYHEALLSFKSGHYDEARTAIEAAEKARPGDPPTEILKARILTELADYAGAKKALQSLNGNAGLTPALADAQTLAFGDLCLRKRSFDEAAKFYESLLAHKPGDPDLILKIVYTRVGISDLLDAAKYASQLKPFDPAQDPLDPKHPGNPSYYFAKAALAQSTGNAQGADDNIQTARTLYGITVTNHYLKTYFEVFTSTAKSPSSAMTPEPLLKPAPTGATP